MIARRANVFLPFRGYVPQFVLECATCGTFVHSNTRDAVVTAAREAGWSPDETEDGAEVYLCPKHAPAGDL